MSAGNLFGELANAAEESIEARSVCGRLGKWASGAPRKGWVRVGEHTHDVGVTEICEMCERARIRYVHILRHDDYPDELRVGRKCATRMTEDCRGAIDRHERRMREQARDGRRRVLRETWTDVSRWTPVPNGAMRVEGRWEFRITWVRAGDLMVMTWSARCSTGRVHTQRALSFERAALAAFDAAWPS